MAGSESGECYSISMGVCRWITALFGLICVFLVSGVFCVTSGLVKLIANACIVLSTACTAAVF